MTTPGSAGHRLPYVWALGGHHPLRPPPQLVLGGGSWGSRPPPRSPAPQGAPIRSLAPLMLQRREGKREKSFTWEFYLQLSLTHTVPMGVGLEYVQSRHGYAETPSALAGCRSVVGDDRHTPMMMDRRGIGCSTFCLVFCSPLQMTQRARVGFLVGLLAESPSHDQRLWEASVHGDL
ncbi:hypothetical protein G5I_01477 [Acromyrmex echinatior]|uniref:Uncharacterized protein n=1 Tax=Acromyrmex echinatior TaxID=103372 RepID=F4W7Q6_ACREC|nr:hypothetical protein G5I_01477 [Acromyrmex echinatior]